MKRLVCAGLLLGTANGVAAAVALYLVYRTAPDAAFGWFAYAPLNENVVYDYYGASRGSTSSYRRSSSCSTGFSCLWRPAGAGCAADYR